MTVQELDKNFAVKENLTNKNIKIYDVHDEPFKIYGLLEAKKCKGFVRIAEDVADKISDGVKYQNYHTAGGRVRFKTNSDYIAIIAKMPSIGKMAHFTLAGSGGFDLYVKEGSKQVYVHSFIPPFDYDGGYESEFYTNSNEMKDYILNLPLYSSVSELYIVLSKDARVEGGSNYKYEKPIVYYGSSITQGGCASRPGNSYQSMISQLYDCDYINLGYSGSAKAEKEIAEYIAELGMSIFVYDYDYNAPDAEFLKKTHEPMFKIIRDRQPNLPIICVSKPNYYTDVKYSEERKNIILETVNNAKANGDKNVYFINGREFSDGLLIKEAITVDGCHPNDLGFMCMAKIIGNKVINILQKH